MNYLNRLVAYKQAPMSPIPEDMSLANVTGLSLSDKQSQEILKKFHLAIKRVSSEHGTDKDFSLTQDELIKLIQAWEPQRDIICLYV